MITTRRIVALATVLATGLAALAGCTGTGAGTTPTGLTAGRGDLNPAEYEDLWDGGDLRWPVDFLPDSFNAYQVNGTSEETEVVINALMPRLFDITSDGKPRLNTDYLISAKIINTVPQTVSYVIQPSATWSDGTPITWRDFEAQWKALNGSNPAYQAVYFPAYGEIANVTRGADDKEAIVTFEDTFAEWRGLFSPLYPASTNSDPQTFNTAWLGKIPVSAGPFRFGELNPVARTLTLVRDERWWGQPAKLERITYKVYEPFRLVEGFVNNDIDFFPIDTDVELLRQARTIPGLAIRQALTPTHLELLVGGGPGSPLADQQVRRAIASAIDRAAITRAVMGELAPSLRPQGNHLYPVNSAEYRDNANLLPFDTAKAAQDLEALGWVQQGDLRARGGQPLQIRVGFDADSGIGEQIATELRNQLSRIGVSVVPQPLPTPAKDLALAQGNFDLMLMEREHNTMPLSSALPRYYPPAGRDLGQNYGQIYHEQIVEDLDAGIEELNDIQRATIGDGADQLIWTVVHSVPLFPLPETYGVRDTLANFGAPGLADLDYSSIGFLE